MSPALHGVGVDPGARSGAVVLLRDSAGVLDARWSASWTRLIRRGGAVWRLTWRLWENPPEVQEYAALPDLYAALAAALRRAVEGLSGVDALPVSVAVEGLFWDPRSPAPELYEATGDLIGCLSRVGLQPDSRPAAATWRPAVLGIAGNTKAATAELAAIRWATAPQCVWPEGAPAETAAEEGALAEAAAIALYGIRDWRSRAGRAA